MCIQSNFPTILRQSSARLLIFVFPVAPVAKEKKKSMILFPQLSKRRKKYSLKKLITAVKRENDVKFTVTPSAVALETLTLQS